MEDFKEGDHSEQRATEKEEVCGRKCDLPDIFSRELIQAGQDEKSQQSQANENGKYMAPLLGFFQGIDFKEMLLLDTLPGPQDYLPPFDLEKDRIHPCLCLHLPRLSFVLVEGEVGSQGLFRAL